MTCENHCTLDAAEFSLKVKIMAIVDVLGLRDTYPDIETTLTTFRGNVTSTSPHTDWGHDRFLRDVMDAWDAPRSKKAADRIAAALKTRSTK